jgi:hypothetical protein
MSMLDYSLLFMVFSFAGVWVLLCPGPVLDYFPGVGIRDTLMVYNAHLFLLQFYVGSFRGLMLGGFQGVRCPGCHSV